MGENSLLLVIVLFILRDWRGEALFRPHGVCCEHLVKPQLKSTLSFSGPRELSA